MKFDPEIMAKVRRKQAKAGMHYITPDSASYKTLKVIYILVFIYTAAVSILGAVSYYVRNFDMYTQGKNDAQTLTQIKERIIAVALFLLVAAAGLVFCCLKKHLPFIIANTVSCAGLFITFISCMKENIADYGILSFMLKHGICIIVLLIAGTVVAALGLRAYRKDKKAYISVNDNNYEEQFKE